MVVTALTTWDGNVCFAWELYLFRSLSAAIVLLIFAMEIEKFYAVLVCSVDTLKHRYLRPFRNINPKSRLLLWGISDFREERLTNSTLPDFFFYNRISGFFEPDIWLSYQVFHTKKEGRIIPWISICNKSCRENGNPSSSYSTLGEQKCVIF